MRPDGTSTSNSNGFSSLSNGSSSSPPQKPDNSSPLNQPSPPPGTNGQAQANGSTNLSAPVNTSTYFGHDREEVTRILIQSLNDLGYVNAASALGRESGYDLESPSVAAFRTAVLNGNWADAERILLGSFYSDKSGVGGSNIKHRTNNGKQSQSLVLAEGADRNEMLFLLRRQKFLELLEGHDVGPALVVLRQELTPLNHDIARLHALSRYAMLYFTFLVALWSY